MRKRAVARKKQREVTSLIIWGGVAAALGVGVVIGVGKMWGVFGRWREDVGRDKPPWERMP